MLLKDVLVSSAIIMKSCIFTLLLAALGAGVSAQTKKITVAPGVIANVVHEPGSSALKVLIPGVEEIELELTQPASNTFLIKTADYNGDGFKDFAFTSKDPIPGAPTLYDIYLYHPLEKTFEALEMPEAVCPQFSNVRVNPADKTLRSSCRSGTKSSMDIFRWADAYSLELVKSVDNSKEAQEEVAEEKAEQKADKAEQRKDVRENRAEQRKARKEETEEDD